MKKKEKTQYHVMSKEELHTLLGQIKNEMTLLAFAKQTKQSKNSRDRRVLRHKYAVVQSIARLKELGVT